MAKHIITFIFSFLISLFLLCFVIEADDHVPSGIVIDRVPFFAQEAYQCGPTVLAIVLDYWYERLGKSTRVTPDEIASEIYSPTAKGVLGLDLVLYAKKRGFNTDQYAGTIEDLKQKVDQGIPIIIFVDYGFAFYKVHHFMVVKGYTGHGIVVNAGKRENEVMSYETLDKIWKKNDYWALVVRP
jgi:ABC-type bacteriocin/lantibiotic exporter with double-glycine peptidase domain